MAAVPCGERARRVDRQWLVRRWREPADRVAAWLDSGLLARRARPGGCLVAGPAVSRSQGVIGPARTAAFGGIPGPRRARPWRTWLLASGPGSGVAPADPVGGREQRGPARSG